MKFNCNDACRLVDIRSFTSKGGKELTFLKLASILTYENIEVLPVQGFDISKLKVGSDYSVTLHFDGRYADVELSPLVK